MIWKIRDREIKLEKTLLMGVLNVTPDSFSDGGYYLDPEKAVRRALEMVKEGADILDIGGESTRPGAVAVSLGEELNRVVPVLEAVLSHVTVPVSMDTTKPEVARFCLAKGAHIINDISGLKDSGMGMAEVVREFGAGLVLMHRRGNPQTMQSLVQYEDVVEEVLRELGTSIEIALSAGITREQLVIDPGLGFAKTARQNIEILSRLERFHDLGLPVLVGPSRKSFIGKVTGREIGEREFGTAAAVALSVMKGIHIVRVHEIGPMRDSVRMAEALRGVSHVRTFQMGID